MLVPEQQTATMEKDSMETKQSLLVLVSGRPGSGKTKLVRSLLEDLAAFVPSMLTSTTTREARRDDIDGEYECVSTEAFEDLCNAGAFLWDVENSGTRYGTRTERFTQACTSGLHFAIVTPDSLSLIRKEAALRGAKDRLLHIYLDLEDENILRERMQRRGDKAESIERKLAGSRDWKNQIDSIPNLSCSFFGGVWKPEDTKKEALRLIKWRYLAPTSK